MSRVTITGEACPRCSDEIAGWAILNTDGSCSRCERDRLREQVLALRDTLGPMAYGNPRPTLAECHTAARSVLEHFPRPKNQSVPMPPKRHSGSEAEA